MVGQQVVVEKDGVIGIFGKQFFCLLYVFRKVQLIALKSFNEPAMPAAVVIQQKHLDRCSFGAQVSEAELDHQTAKNTHKYQRRIQYNIAKMQSQTAALKYIWAVL